MRVTRKLFLLGTAVPWNWARNVLDAIFFSLGQVLAPCVPHLIRMPGSLTWHFGTRACTPPYMNTVGMALSTLLGQGTVNCTGSARTCIDLCSLSLANVPTRLDRRPKAATSLH